jgi:hypothetical protein
MRRVSMATRDALLAAVSERYRASSRVDKKTIIDEFAASTGYHRKHAMRVLRTGPSTKRTAPRPSRRIYGAAEREALIVLWEASDRVCGKRLKAIIPTLIEAMERPYSGSTELAPLLAREHTLLVDVLGEIRRRLSFPLLGFDTDNDTVFMNETVRDYCAAEKIEFTRCRPYRKNDQAHVEQKNGEIVRRMVGYRRDEGVAAAAQLAKLYSPARLFVNAFQPCFKLAEKTRNGAQVKKRYHRPLTPCDRLLTDARVDAASRDRIVKLRSDLDPVRLLSEIRSAQQSLVMLADTSDAAWLAASEPEPMVPLDNFVAGLRTAWQDGEVRPTSQPKLRAKRGRRRPDPLADVTDDLRAWFETDPSLSGRQMLDRLQAEHPGQYPHGLVRTVQRRLKIWRSALAHALVFGRNKAASDSTANRSAP